MSFYLISTAILAATSAFAAATPAPGVSLHKPEVYARDDFPFSIVPVYSDSACQNLGNNGGGQAVYGSGTLSCHQTGNTVGTQVKGSGCQTYFYNDNSCSSGQLLVPDSGCNANVGSFSIVC